jgi:serine/threonine protein kinase
VFAELLAYKNNKAQPLSSKNRVLFQGDSCFPLSPNTDYQIDSKDQLRCVLKCLGNPTESLGTWSDENEVVIKKYLQSILKTRPLDSYFTKEVKSEFMEILRQMLTFNPHKRPTAAQLLQNPMFDSIRNPSNEKPASHKITMDIDGEGVFDYVKLTDSVYTLADYKAFLIEEQAKLKCNL